MNNFTQEQIFEFLSSVDKSFPTPLSDKQNLLSLAQKFYEKGTLCGISSDGELVSLVAGYTENLPDNKAYISVVATLESARGKGYARKALKEFVEICKRKNIEAVHLYTDKQNAAALNMYRQEGFCEWLAENEPRPDDCHLILNLREKQ